MSGVHGLGNAVAAVPALAGKKVVVGQNTSQGNRVSMDRVDHRQWDGLLQKYVDDEGQVAYRKWKASSQDTALLDAYLRELSRAESRKRSSRQGRMAFWINAYNAVTVRGILREYPTTSIRKHTSKFGGYNIWKDLLLVVGDSKVSLNDMEHEILRKVKEPRIHFAIVCASASCPRLLNRAYTARTLEQQLTTNTENFFANRANFRYQDGRFYLSSILKWFAEDFGETQQEQLKAIAPYLPDAISKQAAQRGVGRVSYLSYDWGLNEQPSPRTARRR